MARGAANAMERKRDRISELPEFIIHQILSYLSTAEATRTAVLSKTWLQAWSTSPILDFNELNFSESTEFEEYNRHEFFNFVNSTLLRYRTHNLRIQKFEIFLLCVDQAPAYHPLDQSIGTALGHGVKELGISVETTVKLSPYTLPQTIFSTSAKALTDLWVHQCKFPQNTASNAINFPFLKTLDLHLAYIDDGMLQKLLSSCPSVEKVVLFRVLGFKKFLVSNLGELKILYICSRGKTIEVDIEDAPSLHVLKYWGSFKLPCYLKVGSVQNLKHLELSALTITDNFLNEPLTKFHLLKVLKISYCNGLERINVSGCSLKHLHLEGCEDLMEANIDAPNLLTLKYNGDKVLSLSLVNTPEKLMVDIYIDQFDFGWPDITLFHQLRELLKSVKGANVSYYVWLKGVQFRTDKDLIANLLPLENFMPEINQSYSLLAALVETLFSSSRPTTISTERRLAAYYADFAKFLGNELIMATRNINCCSSDQETKCWRHYLKDIKVEVYENSQNAWQPLPRETLLVQSTCLDKNNRFSLKWNANLNAQY